ncbi:phage portal protein [Actinocrispum wychmicini]|uniref:HK97 family phage portal protein n=1 Tax=Actinocrispum wychmicini TaxID=1213861 RepID=A0A4R2KEI7_9PSEU|nr:phage portal protein [Actinocrispum wychmicini]TCO64945.1 HK97 family phage portal protein [Actinocrispum wychmicini]
MSYVLGRREQRQFQFINPPIPPNSQAGGTYGGSLDLSRTEASLQKIAVWSCVNLVATIAEILPVDVYTGQDADRKPVPMPAWMADLDGTGHGLGDWLYQYVFSAMLRGNDFGTVLDRDPIRGTPTQIVLQHPDEVRLRRDPVDGTLTWYVNNQEVKADRMWHRRVHPMPGRTLGLSPIELHALTIGLGISSLQFGSQWFRDGAHPSGILSNDELDLKNKAQADTAKARFLAAVRGTREPVVLGKGWKFDAIQVAPNESQFLETNNYTSAECCNIFGPGFAQVFGYSTGNNSLTYQNIEQRSLDLLTYAADPWLVRVERVLSALLPKPREVKFNRGALLKTDLLTRFRAHEIALRNRFETVNEVRALEELGPVPWGEEPNPPSAAPAPDMSEGGHQS